MPPRDIPDAKTGAHRVEQKDPDDRDAADRIQKSNVAPGLGSALRWRTFHNTSQFSGTLVTPLLQPPIRQYFPDRRRAAAKTTPFDKPRYFLPRIDPR